MIRVSTSMAGVTYLIVNADDFGQSRGVNEGIMVAHERGIVTSASLMVRWPAAESAAAYARAHPRLSLGLHVDLGEWVFQNGSWAPLYEVVPTSDRSAVEQEVSRQLTEFVRLVGRDPTHIDSHQHVHRREPVRSILAQTARQLALPLREYSPGVHYCGDFYGQTAEGAPLPELLTVENLIAILEVLPTGVTELGCHPGLTDDVPGMYRSERSHEARVLCDPRIQAVVNTLGIQLRGF